MTPCLRRWCLGFERCNFPRVLFRRLFQALSFYAVQKSIVKLLGCEPFSKGGNRLCFVDPASRDVCLKVDQPHRTPEKKREQRGLMARFRPIDHFDENLQEYRALRALYDRFPRSLTRHLPQTFGLVETDQGIAHSMELVRDEDGLISETVERYLWVNGMDGLLDDALDEFRRDWMESAPPSRDLLPHNLLLRRNPHGASVILVDGFGRSGSRLLPTPIRRLRAVSKLRKLDDRINEVLRRKQVGASPKERIGHLKRDQ